MTVKRILVVDDHPLMREGLKGVLLGRFSHWVIGEAANAAETLSATRRQDWDLVLLDLSIPGANGLELLRRVVRDKPTLPILMLSMHPEEQFAALALRAGAAAYMSKFTPAEALLAAIRRVLEGHRGVTSQTLGLQPDSLSGEQSTPIHEQLSDRELDVFLRIGRGQSVGDIAEALRLSVKTVSTYRARVRSKTGFRNNAAMAQYAIRNHLVE